MSKTPSGRAFVALARALAVLFGLGLVAATVAPAQEPEPRIDPAQIKPLASRSLLLDGVAVGGLMVAVGERGHILLSRDGGVSWQQAESPTRADLTGVFFHDEQSGWAVGHDAAILRTVDGGESWELLNYAPEEERPFLDVWFQDAEHGVAIGAYGFFYTTSDGGDSWSSEEFSPEEGQEEVVEEGDEFDYYDYATDYHLNQVARSETGKLFIAAEAGNIYRSDDGGETWVTLPSPYDGSFFGTLPLDGDSLLLFGLRGHMFRSQDAGATWAEIDTGTQAALTDGLRLADGRLVVAGLAGTLLVSADEGRSFTLRQQADRQGLATVLQAADGALVLVGEFGVHRLPAEALGDAASR